MAEVLDFNETEKALIKKKILKLKNVDKDILLLTGTVKEKLALADMEYKLDVLAKDPSPEVRKEVVKHSSDLTPFLKDPSSIVRHEVAVQLKKIMDCIVPEIKIDGYGKPYVVDTPERQMISSLVSDLSFTVSTVAKQTLDDLKKKEVKEAINLVLKRSDLDDVFCSVAKDLNKSLQEKFNNNEINEIPVRSVNDLRGREGINI